MTRPEKKNDPSFKLIAMNNLDSHRLFDLANSRGFEFGNAFTRSALIPGGGTGGFLHQPPSVMTSFELGNYLDLQEPMSLLDEENSVKISFENVLKFTALVNGGDDALFETPVKGADGFYTLKSVNPNAPGRRGKLNRLKLETRNSSQALLMLIKNNMENDSWKALQLKCMPYRYKCEDTHQIVECGEVWFKVLTMNTVPSSMMRGLQHKMRFDNYSFKDDAKWNPATYIAEQDLNQNKTRICMGPQAITDQRYCEKMFLEMDPKGPSPLDKIPLWKYTVMHEKSDWANSAPGEGKSKEEICGVLTNTYRNLEAEGRWIIEDENPDDAKFLALVTKLEQNQKKLETTTKALKDVKQTMQQQFSSSGSTGNASSKSKASSTSSAFSEKVWRTTNKGPEAIHPKTNKKFVWCGLGHAGGCYMPEGHDHEQWAKEKKETKRLFNEKRKLEDGDLKPAA
eukprot:scaffold240609_cov23-Cyclotella_meneghiniana.AAC.1